MVRIFTCHDSLAFVLHCLSSHSFFDSILTDDLFFFFWNIMNEWWMMENGGEFGLFTTLYGTDVITPTTPPLPFSSCLWSIHILLITVCVAPFGPIIIPTRVIHQWWRFLLEGESNHQKSNSSSTTIGTTSTSSHDTHLFVLVSSFFWIGTEAHTCFFFNNPCLQGLDRLCYCCYHC